MSTLKRNFWPYAIIIYFAVFISGMASWIVFAVRNDMELVRKDYYDHEIKYQDQLDREARTRALARGSGISVSSDARFIRVSVPAEHVKAMEKGQIHLYRPSNSKLDQEIAFQPRADGSQMLNVSDLSAGLWKVRLSWVANGEDYFAEQAVVAGIGK